MQLFRIHIKPDGGDEKLRTITHLRLTFKYCLENQLLGVGYQSSSDNNAMNWQEYCDELKAANEKISQACSYIHENVRQGDLIWTRDPDGQYYLAHILSEWEYWISDEAKRNNVDVANVFRCEFQKVATEEVPGKVVACFRPARIIQKIGDDAAIEYSKHLWNKLSGIKEYNPKRVDDIFMMLDAEETEDLLFLYLQTQGWYVVPNLRKADTMKYEYMLIKSSAKHERAYAQVKTGKSSLNREEYSHDARDHKVILFQTYGIYEGAEAENVECIDPSLIVDFMNNSLDWLPHVFRTKSELLINAPR